MRLTKVTLVALVLGGGAGAAPQDDAPEMFQVRAREVVLGDGSRIENGVLLVEGASIRKVGRGVELDPNFPIIEHDGVLTAGIVVCHTHSGAEDEASDSTRSLLPEARLVHAFDPGHSDWDAALAAGITTLVLAPTEENVAGGLTAVVKSAGGRVLSEEGHLALSLTHGALTSGPRAGIFFFGQASARAGGPEDTESSQRGSREPTSFPGVVHALGQRLGDADGPFRRAAAGELPVLMEAWDRNEVQRALGLATEHGLGGALYGAPRAGELAAEIAASGLGVVLGPFERGQTRASLESLARLAEAGVPVAFALDGPDHAPAEVRFSAAMAVGVGVDRDVVWQALTTDAARIAGVSDRVGSLERGKDADFVLWSGDPLDLRSKVVAVYVDGRLVHEGGAR